jgi:8-oxo-dGTP diphosphatase
MTEPRPVVAVGGIVIHDGGLLMIRRGKEPNLGLWSVPGGRVEPGEYLADACRREVREETGIEVEVGELAGIFEVTGRPHYVILDFLASPIGSTEPVAADDAAAARWVPLGEVAALDCTPRFVELLTAWGVLGL